MARNNFIACLSETLSHEGGLADNPKDPGGATMKGGFHAEKLQMLADYGVHHGPAMYALKAHRTAAVLKPLVKSLMDADMLRSIDRTD